MDLYEYQARELLEEQGIPTPKAVFAQNSHEVAEAAEQIGYPNVIKAQVKIGHRGQAGGVKLAKTRDEAILASAILTCALLRMVEPRSRRSPRNTRNL